MGPETFALGNINFGYSGSQSLPFLQNEIQERTVTTIKIKPAVPKKPGKFTADTDTNGSIHVKEMVRRLQEKVSSEGIAVKSRENFAKMGVKASKSLPVTGKEKVDVEAADRTLDDLKAIDEDIEKLRKQIEERDKIIGALREAAEAKDKKIEVLMVEYSKHRPSGKLDSDTSSESSNCVAISSPSSPPLCDGELCWTDNFVNENYHAPVYVQLLNDHTTLQRIHRELQAKLESKEKEFGRLEEKNRDNEEEEEEEEEEGKIAGHENAINLIMAEQIRVLKEREAQLEAEAEDLREQRDLMEFRILELEESRKEFLDKEVINSEETRHRREKMVWTERDVEDVSDSGVMSLPTSEDLTSDSEMGDAIRNYSPLGAVTNLSLPSPETLNSDSDFKSKKSLKSPECCLQESGIFEDPEPSTDTGAILLPTKQTRGCQTESILDKTLLDFIDSSCDLLLASRNRQCLGEKSADDLTKEISKLSVIQKRIQQKTSPEPKGRHTIFTCPHTNSVLFYEERLAQLEDKLKIYESSGDTKETLLARRLQKEVELACRVKELNERVATLEVTNRRLEEEKCEFEEAENDARFQCQRLEIRLKEFLDKNAELEVELERLRIKMNEVKQKEKKKESLENLINRYEQRNFELEERQVEAKQKLTMIEAAMPAIVAWNMFRIVHNPDFVNLLPSATPRESDDRKTREQDVAMFQRLEELLDDQKKLRRDYEKVEESAADREKALKIKIEELETKAAKDREILEEMTNSLKALKAEEKGEAGTSSLFRPDDVDLFEELKHMVVNEIQLRAEIERLEKKERAYMNSLETADEVWAGMEADYKKRLKEAEMAGQELQKRVSQLEATQAELEKALEEKSGEGTNFPEAKNEVKTKIEELLLENEKLKLELTKSLDRKFDEHKRFLESENLALKDELKKMKFDFVKEEKKYILLQKELEIAKGEVIREREVAERLRKEVEEKNKSVSAMEMSLQNQISDLNHELSQKGKELSNLEVTVAELREEVETLENKVAELVETIQTTISSQEEGRGSVASSKVVRCSPTSADEAVAPHARQKASDLLKREVIIKEEMDLPQVQVLMPSKYFIRCLVFAATCFSPRQETKHLFPRPVPAMKMRVEFAQSPPTVALWIRNPVKSERVPESSKDDEIFQLCVKNTELQQTLEKMEEEAKQKEKELEELQKIALEIRNEQMNLELLYEGRSRRFEGSLSTVQSADKTETSAADIRDCDDEIPEEPTTTPSIDILQIFNPIVLKTPDHVSAPISNLQIAFDNLQSKCRAKNFVIRSLLEELQQKGDTLDYEELINKLSVQCPGVERKKIFLDDDDDYDGSTISQEERSNSRGDPDLNAVAVYKNPRSLAPNNLGRSSSAYYSMLSTSGSPKDFGWKTSLDVDAEFSYVAPIRTVRKVGDNGIFLEWDIAHKPDVVTGYEIFVDGLPGHRVRSSSRNKALLHSANPNEKMLIQLYATSERGRSTRCSHVTYPEGLAVYRSESL